MENNHRIRNNNRNKNYRIIFNNNLNKINKKKKQKKNYNKIR
jgi:hypothetical protein